MTGKVGAASTSPTGIAQLHGTATKSGAASTRLWAARSRSPSDIGRFAIRTAASRSSNVGSALARYTVISTQ